MDYRYLSKWNLKISQLGFGCCPMGLHEWGYVCEEDLIRAVDFAVEHGINFFDTADIYGLGASERILGKALGSRRSDVLICTKFGVRINDAKVTFYDNSPCWLSEALDASLCRLNTDYIDLYIVHYRDQKTPLDVLLEALERKREEGKIRLYGFSNVVAEDLSAAILPEAAIGFQNEYSLANRRHEPEIRHIVKMHDLLFFSWGSLGQGILSGKYDRSTVFHQSDRRHRSAYKNFHGERLDRNLQIVSALKRISAHTSKTLTQIAIRWILDHLQFGVVLTGVKTPKQIEENIGAFGWNIKPEDLSMLDSLSKDEAR